LEETGEAGLKATEKAEVKGAAKSLEKRGVKTVAENTIEDGLKSGVKRTTKVGISLIPFVGTAGGSEFDVRTRPELVALKDRGYAKEAYFRAATANIVGDILGGVGAVAGSIVPYGGTVAGGIGGQVGGEMGTYALLNKIAPVAPDVSPPLSAEAKERALAVIGYRRPDSTNVTVQNFLGSGVTVTKSGDVFKAASVEKPTDAVVKGITPATKASLSATEEEKKREAITQYLNAPRTPAQKSAAGISLGVVGGKTVFTQQTGARSAITAPVLPQSAILTQTGGGAGTLSQASAQWTGTGTRPSSLAGSVTAGAVTIVRPSGTVKTTSYVSTRAGSHFSSGGRR
jgi:hypothetical protein